MEQSKTTTLKCNAGHALVYTNQAVEGYWGGGVGFICDIGRHGGKFADGAFRCAECKYDVCMECIEIKCIEAYDEDKKEGWVDKKEGCEDKKEGGGGWQWAWVTWRK